MKKIGKMNKEIFRAHLLMAVEEIRQEINLDIKQMEFQIVAIHEPGKPLLARDEQMRLWALSEKNVGSRLLSLEETVLLLTSKVPFVPIWVNISYIESKAGTAMFKLETSLRFRKPSLLRNVETGHPPFKTIMKR